MLTSCNAKPTRTSTPICINNNEIQLTEKQLEVVKEEITEIKIDTASMIPKEDVVVMVTKDGYIKRTSFRSYSASNPEDITIKESDLERKKRVLISNELFSFENIEITEE